VTTLVVAAHGSRDPRAAANTYAVAEHIRSLRAGLDVRVAFCEQSTPNLSDVLTGTRGPAVVAPLLLADAYHARVDMPKLIAASGTEHTTQAPVLGEDPRLLRLMRQRLAAEGASRFDGDLGVLVVAVGSSNGDVNRRTATVADTLNKGTRWVGAVTAFATGPQPSLHDAAERLRNNGAKRLVIAPWFLAHGLITDRVAAYANQNGIAMAAPLGAHPLVAQTVLDRFDEAVQARAAA
jgi:sirohydrochlorin ferrochelatase